jgi:phytanoyl-CoA hydroxylase
MLHLMSASADPSLYTPPGIHGLCQKQIDQFWRDGFVPLGPILDHAKVIELRHAYAETFEMHASNSLRTDGDERIVSQICGMSDRHLAFRRLAHQPQLLGPLVSLLGPAIQLFHDQALWKQPHGGGAVSWHQDNAYWRCTPALLVTLWLTLDDVVRESGAMQFIPGSHLQPAWHAGEGDGLLRAHDVAEADAVTVELPAGGALLHHCQTLHYTAPNTTARERRAFALHCMLPGTRSSNPDHSDLSISFERPLLCG